MDLVKRYDNSAKEWDRKINRNGYCTAYDAFLCGRTMQSGKVLDVGVGTGAFSSSWIANSGSNNLTIIDISQNMLNRAQLNLRQKCSKLTSICSPLEGFTKDKKYSAILAAHVIEQCDFPKLAIAQVADMLCVGGKAYFVISKPHWCNWIIWLRYRHKWFSQQQVCEMASSSGLQHELTYSFLLGPPSYTSFGYIFKKRKER